MLVTYSYHSHLPSEVIGISIGYIVVHLISIGYLVFYQKLGFRYHLKTARLVILVPQLVYLLLMLSILDNYCHVDVQNTLEIISLILGIGHGMSFAITFSVLIADFCIFQTEGVDTKDIEMKKGIICFSYTFLLI